MRIRKMEPEDAEAVLALMTVFYQSPAVLVHAPEAVLRRCIADCLAGGPYLEGYVFEMDGDLTGYSLVAKGYATEVGGLCVHVEDLYIRPEARGQGIGGAFLDYITDKYQNTAARIRLEVEAENTRAMAVYQKHGFQELPYLQMVKELTK